jgi:outer membrane protein assembly factor BamB
LKPNMKVLCLLSALSVSAAVVQTTSVQVLSAETNTPAAVSTAPVAFVYVSNTPGSGANKVNAYAAAANGKLTPVSGSPFADNLTSMVVNGKYLLGSNKAGVFVAAFLIQSNGALHWTTSTDVARFNTNGCVFPAPLILDHTGANLYLPASVGGLCDSTQHLSFTIDKPTGGLRFLGSTSETFLFDTPLSFSANNLYAYGTDCVEFQTGFLDTFHVYKRGSNGLLTLTAISPPTPPPPTSGDFYCRSQTAADPSNHLAVSVQAIDLSTSQPDGQPQLATYTADASGNLTTPSTSGNMPGAAVGFVTNLSMSPSGKLLAVAGQSGLQIFHFNGNSPITAYTGLLTTDDVEQCFWDNANHLYAISQTTGKLRVFTITPTSNSQAPGSPYSIHAPANIIVQPK